MLWCNIACLNFKDWPFVTSPKILAISKFFWNKSDLCWISASKPLRGSRPNCGSSVNWPLYVCSYNYFASRAKGKSVSEIRGRLLVLSWIVNGTPLLGNDKDKIGKFSTLEQISWKILSTKPQIKVNNSIKKP